MSDDTVKKPDTAKKMQRFSRIWSKVMIVLGVVTLAAGHTPVTFTA